MSDPEGKQLSPSGPVQIDQKKCETDDIIKCKLELRKSCVCGAGMDLYKCTLTIVEGALV